MSRHACYLDACNLRRINGGLVAAESGRCTGGARATDSGDRLRLRPVQNDCTGCASKPGSQAERWKETLLSMGQAQSQRRRTSRRSANSEQVS